MKIIVEQTTKIVELNGVPARIWEGITDGGIKVHCFITRIACDIDDTAANELFAKQLQVCRDPSPEIERVYPLRMVL